MRTRALSSGAPGAPHALVPRGVPMAEDPAFFGLVLSELRHGVGGHGGRRPPVDGGGDLRRVLPVTADLYIPGMAGFIYSCSPYSGRGG